MLSEPKLSIVLSTHEANFSAIALKGDFEANIAKIASWGYSGVELAIRDPSLLDKERLLAVLNQHRMKVPAIGTGQAWGEEGLSFTSADPSVRRAAVDRIKAHISLAKNLNSLVIIGLIRGVTPQGQSNMLSMQYLIENLQECVKVADAEGVRLALEPINRYETDLIPSVTAGMDLLIKVGSANLGLLLDTFHMNIEEKNIEESISICSKHIFHFHVADSNRKYPGAGHINFESILNVLGSASYQGWISGEFMPYPDPDTAAQRNIEFLRNILP